MQKDELLIDAEEKSNRAQQDQLKVHKAEMEALSLQHQRKCAHLDGKLADAEKCIDQLKKEKAMLEQTLSKDKDEKVKVINRLTCIITNTYF